MIDSQVGTLQTALNVSSLPAGLAARLATVSGLAERDVAGRSLASLRHRLSPVLQADLLGLRRIDGRVVRKHPATGALQPVPGATVHVEDTDGSFLLYSPPQWPDWSWLVPFKVRREEIAIAHTDARGRFSVGIPRWDVEAITAWRQGRIRFSDFSRPRLRDVVKDLDGCSCDSAEAAIRKADFLARCRKRLGRPLARRIESLLHEQPAGTAEEIESLLETPIAPERPCALAEIGRPELLEILKAVAGEHGISPQVVEEADFGPWIGPLWRGSHLVLKLWTPLLDAPDITFRVTGDRGKGVDEEVLYSGGFFDVAWNQGGIPDLTLTAFREAPALRRSLRPEQGRLLAHRPKPRFAAAPPAMAA
ncbi:MAG: hypothetical protein ABJC13_09150 [Acidobacteriota bacterium]